MKITSKNTVFLLVLLAILSCKSQTVDKKSQDFPFYNTSLSIDARIQDLISRLTLEEKADQMMNNTPAIERLGILPYSYWNEALHGVGRSGIATVFPQAIGLGATF